MRHHHWLFWRPVPEGIDGEGMISLICCFNMSWRFDMTPERRTFGLNSVEIDYRSDSKHGSKPFIVGHAAVFNVLSEDMGGFREKIQPGAFDHVLKDDVRALFNHNPNIVLGRTRAGTLRLSVDKAGLRYEINPPDTTGGKDLLAHLKRGDVSHSSFAFVVERDEWGKDAAGRVIRTILSIRRLIDVSPVTFPAYLGADSGFRGHEEKENDHKSGSDCWRSQINIMEREILLAEL